jgi:hypothetical protein
VGNRCADHVTPLYPQKLALASLTGGGRSVGPDPHGLLRQGLFYYYIHTEFFKRAAHTPFFSLQNAVYFIMLPILVHLLFTFYIQGVQKFKCQIPVPKG